MAHEAEYLAAAAGMAETYGRPVPPLGSVVWFPYGNGVSSGRVLASATRPGGMAGVALSVQRSASEILEIDLEAIQEPPRFVGVGGARPAVGELVWFTVHGGQMRGIVEQVRPDGNAFLVRSSESGEVVEVAAGSILNF